VRGNWCHGGGRPAEAVAVGLYKLECQLAVLLRMHPHCPPTYCIVCDNIGNTFYQSAYVRQCILNEFNIQLRLGLFVALIHGSELQGD